MVESTAGLKLFSGGLGRSTWFTSEKMGTGLHNSRKGAFYRNPNLICTGSEKPLIKGSGILPRNEDSFFCGCICFCSHTWTLYGFLDVFIPSWFIKKEWGKNQESLKLIEKPGNQGSLNPPPHIRPLVACFSKRELSPTWLLRDSKTDILKTGVVPGWYHAW